jgi:hypothetical protein
MSFFPSIRKEKSENVSFDVQYSLPSSATTSSERATGRAKMDSESDSEYELEEGVESLEEGEDFIGADVPNESTVNDNCDVDVEEVDELFIHIFVDKPKIYNSPKELDPDIDKYESLSGNRLIIHKSDEFARTYKCATHVGCCFRAKFGKVPKEEQMTLKSNLTKAAHIGERITRLPNDRKPKRRIKGRLDATIDQVAVVKSGKPVAKDVMKAAASLEGLTVTYKQSHRALQQVAKRKWEQDKGSFQLVIPYLSKFEELNPDSTVDYQLEIDADGNYLNRVFVCPGIMKRTLDMSVQ